MSFDTDLKCMVYGPFSSEAVFNGEDIRVQFVEEGEIRGVNGFPVEYENPAAFCYPPDVENAKENDLIIIDGQAYYIMDIKRSYMGETELSLSKEQIYG